MIPADLITIELARLVETSDEWLACPAWISDAFEGDESFMDWLVSEATDQEEAAKDAMAELRSEERRLGL